MLLGMNESLRIVVVAPDLAVADPADEHAVLQAERSRALRIGLLENNFNLIATLPADVFLSDRLAQLQPDLIIVDILLPGIDGASMINGLRRHSLYGQCKLIVLTALDEAQRAVDALSVLPKNPYQEALMQLALGLQNRTV